MKKLECPTWDRATFDNDSVLLEWLQNRFGVEQVHVSYGSKEDCLVPKGNLIVKQVHLPDRRILRCDWSSPQHKGEKGWWFVRVEHLAVEIPSIGHA